MAESPKAAIQSLIASTSPGASMAEASTFTCRGRRNFEGDAGTSASMMASTASAKPVSRHPSVSLALVGMIATPSCCGNSSLKASTVRGTSAPSVSDKPVVISPMTEGLSFSQMVASASTTLLSAPRTVVI